MIEVREWDMHTAESREHFKTANISKLPSIAIAGKLVYEARIPDQDELIEKIKQSISGG